MPERNIAILAMVGACTVWGLSALYYKLLLHVPPTEILSHRVLWSFVIFLGILVVRGNGAQFLGLLRSGRQLKRAFWASLMVSANWFLFIWAVHADRVLETSLGYFMQPLIAVAMGIWIFSERISRPQWIAVALAAVAVTVLTAGQGALPWLSLILGITFAIYGAIKKGVHSGPVTSVTAEAMFILPFALFWLWFAQSFGLAEASGVFRHGLTDTVLLMFSGVLTAGPLMLMSFAAQRLPLATVGVLQYLNPTLQFMCAVLIFSEPFGISHAIAFGLIWTALILYSWAELRLNPPSGRSPAHPPTPQP